MAEITKIGVDVSRHNGVIDWRRVKVAGKVDFVFVRACYGWDNDKQIDTQFRRNASECEKNGIPFGIYHYSYAHNAADAVKEARFFLRVIKGLRPQYPVMFDFEEASQVGGRDARGVYYKGLTPQVQLEVIEAFMRTVEAAGYYAGVYSAASALQCLHLFAPERLARYDCWVAHVQTKRPAFDGKYGVWQYSWTGRVDGIGGNGVDLNYAYKEYPEIIKKAGLNGWGIGDR